MKISRLGTLVVALLGGLVFSAPALIPILLRPLLSAIAENAKVFFDAILVVFSGCALGIGWNYLGIAHSEIEIHRWEVSRICLRHWNSLIEGFSLILGGLIGLLSITLWDAPAFLCIPLSCCAGVSWFLQEALYFKNCSNKRDLSW